ncbi:hydrolase [Pseudohyphozyma bogoriensis]|nr:hydrolase [Pseudohyphozyma bogoriensis]
MSAHHTVQTFVYKRHRQTSYKLDVYLPDVTKFSLVASLSRQILAAASFSSAPTKPAPGEAEDHALPVLLYFHGGGLCSGERENNEDGLDAGFCVISAEYSLFHPASGHDIVEDVKDCVAWIANELNPKLGDGGQNIDPKRIVVSGSSAGGYLTYLAGLYAEPKPKALVPIYPMGGDYLTDRYYNGADSLPYDIPLFTSNSPFKAFCDLPSTATHCATSPINCDDPRLVYVWYLYQMGTLVDVLTGEDGLSAKLKSLPESERGSAIPEKSRYLFPQLVADSTFPPTMVVHGTQDSAVPVTESRSFVQVLKGKGVDAKLVEFDGEHGFDTTAEGDMEEKRRVLGGVVPWCLEMVGKEKK